MGEPREQLRHSTLKYAIPGAALFIPAAYFAILFIALDGDKRLWFQGRVLFWLMPLLLGGLLAIAGLQIRAACRGLKPFFRKNAVGALSALGISLVCAIASPPQMRVQFDETILMETSQTMYRRQANMGMIRALPSGNELQAARWGMAKRPPLFPFIVDGFHVLLGPDIANGGRCNIFLLFVLLTMVFVLVRQRLDPSVAVAAQFLVLCAPINILVATSMGLDLLSTLLFLAVLACALAFLRVPGSSRFSLLWIVGLLFAYARYESVLVFAATMVLCLCLARKSWKIDSWTKGMLLFTPLLLSPLAGMFLITIRPENYEAGADAVVAWKYLWPHAWIFIRAFFDPRFGRPFAGSLNILLVAVAAVLLLRKKWKADHTAAAVGPALSLFIVLLWFSGDASAPTTMRLFLPISLCGCLSPLLLKRYFQRRVPAAALLIASFCMFSFQLYDVHEQKVVSRLKTQDVTDELDQLFERLLDSRKTTLFVSELCPYFVIHRFACISPDMLVNDWPIIEGYETTGRIGDVLYVKTSIDTLVGANTGKLDAVLGRFRTERFAKKERPEPISVDRLLKLGR